MSRVYKTAKGKMIDMDKIKLSNETATAVGNMRVNARGDLLGPGGQIVSGRNQIMDRAYAVESAPDEGYSPNDPKRRAQQAKADATRSKELHDLANGLIDTQDVEPTAEPESTVESAQPTTTARGSLASSIAKKATVTQQPIPDARKPKGPTRI